MITKSLLSKIIKTGNLTWVMPNGEINTYGDGTGDPIKIRTTNNFLRDKIINEPFNTFWRKLYEWITL